MADQHRIVVVGEAWGREEAEAHAPFVGPGGKLLRAMLHQVGIDPKECFFTNVFNFQPKGKHQDNDLKNVCAGKEEALPGYPPLSSGKYVRREYLPELERLYRELRNESPTLIIALGATAAWALLGTTGIRKIRGAPSILAGPALSSLGSPVKVFPTYHPAAVLREWTIRPVVIADLLKASRESRFPELIRPKREIWIEPSLTDLALFERDYITPADSLSIDIETVADQITCVGFSPSIDRAIVVPFLDATRADGNYWRGVSEELKAWDFVRRWCGMTIPGHPQYKRGVGQNFMFDSHRLWRTMGIQAHNADDTMLAHHALQPEMEKGLGFLATVYTEELPWKFMRKKHETLKKED